MTFETKIIKNCKIRQRNLMRPALIANEKPDTGVTILKKGAFYLIKDTADITVKYLALLAYSSYSNPLNQLKGKFTQAEIIDFVGRSKEEAHTRQLLHIVLTDVGCAQFKSVVGGNAKPVEGNTIPVPVSDYSISEDEDDVYGDYDLESDVVEAQPVVAEANEDVDVDDAAAIINKLVEVFDAK